ncbi:MAG: YihY/virulence factor BrkB family protein [Pseudonocardia sp.]|nr:YihY/virulence factor BrkB family protein [Pseudonocardia sp.]
MRHVIGDLAARLDRYQRRNQWLGFPLAVIYKFFDDQGNYLAALIAYYSFVSLFPLLLIFTTVLGFVLDGHPWLQQHLIGTVVAQFPVLGAQLRDTTHPLHGSGTGLWVGLSVALYGGLGWAVAIQHAFDQTWAVPMDQRPDPMRRRLRGLGMLAVLGVGVVLTSALRFLGAIAGQFGAELAVVVPVVALAVSLLLVGGLFVLGFRFLTSLELSTRRVVSGAIVGAVGWQVLQYAGPAMIARFLSRSNQIYGFFGVVLVLLAWLYALALVVVVAAEVNAVQARRLWPRALLGPTPFVEQDTLTSADWRSYQAYARAQRFQDFTRIRVEPKLDTGETPPDAPSAEPEPST